MLALNRAGDWITERREKISKKITAHREKKRPKRYPGSIEKDDGASQDEETARLVQHSRLDCSASDNASSCDPNVLRASQSQSNLEPPAPGFAVRNSSISSHANSAYVSQSAVSNISPTASPPEEYSRSLQLQNLNYAHTAYTPPNETFRDDDEIYRRAFVHRVEKAASEGAFDSEAIESRFDMFYHYRTTVEHQAFASTDFRRRCEARLERRKLRFELMQRRACGCFLSAESRIVTKSEYQLDFHSNTSGLGDVVGEVLRRSGGINGM